ncbi:MAG: hypothetical protein KME42_27985 [Tildeniella nuda ZEHNDER 1965/U140]|nr:hypothetical protein [Tildeniella nuda ZEHNDER 1965/U140]
MRRKKQSPLHDWLKGDRPFSSQAGSLLHDWLKGDRVQMGNVLRIR